MNADYREWTNQRPCPWCDWRPSLIWEWRPRNQRYLATLGSQHQHLQAWNVEGVEPGVYGRAKAIPGCEAVTRSGYPCRRYSRYLADSRLLCRVHAEISTAERLENIS